MRVFVGTGTCKEHQEREITIVSDPIEMPEIVERINEQKCVFLLGPGIAKNIKGEKMQSCLIQYFKENDLKVEEGLDGLYTCGDRKPRIITRALDHLQKYCRDHSEPSNSHQQLARIPCHLYISATPDLLMKKALDENGVDCEFEYYVKGYPQRKVKKPTRANPLLYNLFGCIENQQSIIFNQGDLINYLFSILGEFELPENLRQSLEGANYFIFFGFDFEKWYLRLLLKLILDKSKHSIATEEGNFLNEKLKSFYMRRYGMEFVNTNIEGYISKLYKEFSNQRLLRKKGEKIQPTIQPEVKTMIRQGKVKPALDRLMEFMESENVMMDRGSDKEKLLNELINLSGRFSNNERNFRMGVITREDARVSRAKIRHALLDIASKC